MPYTILDVESVLDYVRTRPESRQRLDPDRALRAVEVGDGNLNLVFKVWQEDRPESTVLVKQALPHVRVAEDWKLSPLRGRFEALSLQSFHALAPGSVPTPLWYDDEQFAIGMDNLVGYEVIRQPMIEGREIPGLGTFVGTAMARVHFGTSDFGLDSADKKRAVAPYTENTELCRITEDLVLMEPFHAGQPRNHWVPEIDDDVARLQADAAVKREVGLLKLAFMTRAQALLHGDLHTGSIMGSGNDLRMIDSEFAFYGPMGFDIGMFIANLLMNAVTQRAHAATAAKRRSYRDYLRHQIVDTMDAYHRTLQGAFARPSNVSWQAPGFFEAFFQTVVEDICGFAGTEMIRRTIGFAHVKDVDAIDDPELRGAVQRQVLAIGRRLIHLHRRVESIDDILTASQEALEF